MTFPIWAWGALALSAAFALAYGARLTNAGESSARSVIKTLPVAILAGVGLGVLGPHPIVFVLIFGALGDLWLSRPGDVAFRLGLVAFAIAHGVLIWLLWPTGGLTWGIAPGAAVVCAGVMAIVILPHAKPLRGPVAGYIAIIAGMGVVALQPGVAPLVTLAAMLFMFSDACLGVALFVKTKDAPVQRILGPVIWFSYWGAQVLFLLAFVSAG